MPMSRRHVVAGAASLSILAPFGGAVSIAGDWSWPVSRVDLIVPFPPGGMADLAAWPIGAELSRHLACELNVAYVTGEAGGAGHARAAAADPDGSTLLMALTAIVMLPEASRINGRTPQYDLAQFRPIARVLNEPTVLVVHPSQPWGSLAELLADARARPGRIRYGSSGNYGTLHVATEMLASAADVRFDHRPYLGAGPVVKDLVDGKLDFAVIGPGQVKSRVDAGRLRALATWGATRASAFPDLPAMSELGYPNVDFRLWAGLFAPAGLPDELVTILRNVVRDAMAHEGVLSVFERAGAPGAYLDMPEFERFVAEEEARLKPVLRRIG